MTETAVRTIVCPSITLTGRKAGLLRRAMKHHLWARRIAAEHIQERDPRSFERKPLYHKIRNDPRVEMPAIRTSLAIRNVREAYIAAETRYGAEDPWPQRADMLHLHRQNNRLFHVEGRYYLNVSTARGDVHLPLVAGAWQRRYLPHPKWLPATTSHRQRRLGVTFEDLPSEAFPDDVVSLRESTVHHHGPRRFGAHLVFEVQTDPTIAPEEAETIIGVDRGRNQLAYAAVYDPEDDHVRDWYNHPGAEVRHRMDTIDARMQDIQQSRAWETMEKLRRLRRNYKDTIDHTIARRIADLASSQGGPTVVALEDLAGLKSRFGTWALENRRHNEWSFARLREYIEYKCDAYGVPVILIDPRGTSKSCSRCGANGERNGVQFSCEDCGYRQHADANAAVNIAKLGREEDDDE